MDKVIYSLILIFLSMYAQAESVDVYVHDNKGIDTSIYRNQTQPADLGQVNGLIAKIKAKRDAKNHDKRESEYTLDLIDSTNGLKNVSADTIRPLIQKYPEKSSELLNMLKQ